MRERATGRTFADDLTLLWADLGCTSDAAVGVDGAGVALAGGAVAATARDWARLAMLAVDGRTSDGRLLDEAWTDAAARPAYPFLAPGAAAEHDHHPRRLRLPLVAARRRRADG